MQGRVALTFKNVAGSDERMPAGAHNVVASSSATNASMGLSSIQRAMTPRDSAATDKGMVACNRFSPTRNKPIYGMMYALLRRPMRIAMQLHAASILPARCPNLQAETYRLLFALFMSVDEVTM